MPRWISENSVLAAAIGTLLGVATMGAGDGQPSPASKPADARATTTAATTHDTAATTHATAATTLGGPSTHMATDVRWARGEELFHDDFDRGLSNWVVELQAGGTVEARGGALVIDVPSGCTAWFKPELTGPLMIEYDATAVNGGGANDRVSDLNCFWMARDTRSPADLFTRTRNGAFADYDALKTYYVGMGGNTNSTTRFRRYIGVPGNRPLRPEHDLKAAGDLLVPNRIEHLQLVAAGSLVQYFRNGERVFELDDPEPYVSGWFGVRTVTNHLKISQFRVVRLVRSPP